MTEEEKKHETREQHEHAAHAAHGETRGETHGEHERSKLQPPQPQQQQQSQHSQHLRQSPQLQLSKRVSQNYGIIIGLVLILIAVITANVFILGGISGGVGGAGASPTPATPLSLSVTRIRAPDCSDCFDVDTVLQDLRANGVVLNVRVLDYSDAEASALVSKYGVKKLPTLLISSDEKRRSEASALLSPIASQASDGTFILNSQQPPFYDVVKKRVVGRVDFVSLIASNCTQCFNVSLLVSQLAGKPPLGLGVAVSSERLVDYSSDEGKRLISAYNISSVPSLIASSDLKEYQQVAALWPRVGSFESDGSLVLRATTPPFVNLSTGKIEGLVELVYLKDSSCSACYDVKLHKQVLEQMGVFVSNETEVEVNSTRGKNLTEAYNVTLVPTVLLSPEASVYGALKQVWEQVGSIESDGWFVFRNMNALQNPVYKNLETGEVIGLPTATATPSALPTPTPTPVQSNQSSQSNQSQSSQSNQSQSSQSNQSANQSNQSA